MIVGPIPAQMDDFCDLHGTLDTPVSRIVTVKPKNEKKMQFSLLLYFFSNSRASQNANSEMCILLISALFF